MKYTFTTNEGSLVHQVELKSSQNKKLGLMNRVIQTYHFSMDQVLSTDLTLDEANCLDCPLSYNAGDGKCYTHKGSQRLGLISKLKWLKKNMGDFSPFSLKYWENYLYLVLNKSPELIRLGAYGEPPLMPFEAVQGLTQSGVPYTGYTHQWHNLDPKWATVLMASTHSVMEANLARDLGWRVFNTGLLDGVNCPASKEAGRKSTCTTCNLCSGTEGKGKKDVYILMH